MLEVRDIQSFYGAAHVLRGVSLNVPDGSIVAVLGRNGMGKTTLIRSIMNFKSPRVAEGTVTYRGVPLNTMKPHEIARQGIGLVPQGRRLFPSLTVKEHLTMAGKKNGAWPMERVFELFPRLAERLHHRGNQLSGGERQMLAVGRALVLDPKVLLMDEPSEGLAPVMVQQLESGVMRLKEAGLAILLVEQNLYSALAVADEAYIIQTGQIVYHDKASALAGDAAAKKQFLGVG